jgi:hypothetical protein
VNVELPQAKLTQLLAFSLAVCCCLFSYSSDSVLLLGIFAAAELP